MWQSLALVFGVIAVVAGSMRLYAWSKRQRALGRIPKEQLVRLERGVSMRILMGGARGLPGMKANRANRTRGDLALTADRLLVTSGRGVLADLAPNKGRRFSAVRVPGPGRLVIEGDVPTSAGPTGHYRIDMRIEDAVGWADALKPFVRDDGEFVVFRPPGVQPPSERND